MRHHFAPWTYSRTHLQGLARVAIKEGEASSTCTRCGVRVKVALGTSTTLFWGHGRWVRKFPCGGTP